MLAFSCMLYVQLGPVMEGFNDQYASFLSLARALFGDFDVAEILNNSRGYLNAMLFLTYLFVAVFIMLSMFFAILGEAQAGVRFDYDEARRMGKSEPEFGIITKLAVLLERSTRRAASLLPLIAKRINQEALKDDFDQALQVKSKPTDMVQLSQELMMIAKLRDEMDDFRREQAGVLNDIKRSCSMLVRKEPNQAPDGGDGQGVLLVSGGDGVGKEVSTSRLVPELAEAVAAQLLARRRSKHGGSRSKPGRWCSNPNSVDGVHSCVNAASHKDFVKEGTRPQDAAPVCNGFEV
eukprot:CAMPEP_0119300368 /NCGR_PEP_ID=MMETSP1333-20130426/2321_1 /TAXON_ID=418940 /ORGANISM="Scyphosphaera apsteinii, Strain RCC1455" /LENGTH=292 /DNA_ID=CAMNT_0007302113 /DNA_START=57 /DNA_END=935 /DNA_ORIENTATION=+